MHVYTYTTELLMSVYDGGNQVVATAPTYQVCVNVNTHVYMVDNNVYIAHMLLFDTIHILCVTLYSYTIRYAIYTQIDGGQD